MIGLFVAVSALLAATSESGLHAQSRSSATSASRKIEFLALLTPTMGVLVLNQFVLFTNFGSAAVTADLVGLQWYWIFDSADLALSSAVSLGMLLGLTVSNIVVISATSLLLLSAVDVIHAIALPTAGLKLDAIPGRLSVSKLDVDFSGLYAGQCSELCGTMHGFMPVQLLVALLACSFLVVHLTARS